MRNFGPTRRAGWCSNHSHAESADKRHEDAIAKFRRTRDSTLAVIEVAFVATVGKSCCDFPQVALPDRFTAYRTKRLRARYPAIHQNKLHTPPLVVKSRSSNIESISAPFVSRPLVDQFADDGSVPGLCRLRVGRIANRLTSELA